MQIKEYKYLEKNCRRFSGKYKVAYVFGTNLHTRYIISCLEGNGLIVKNILDNDIKKNHMYCYGVKVIMPYEISKEEIAGSIFVIYSAFWKEMQSQLLNMGVQRSNIVVLHRESFYAHNFLYRFLCIYKGKRIIDKIKNKYEKDSKIFLCPYSGMGDVYLVGTYFFQYLLKEEIDKYVFLVVNNACRQIAELFYIENVELLEKKEDCLFLVDYYMFYPEESNLKILNDSWEGIYTNPIKWLRGYRKIDFSEMFRKYVFELPADTPHLFPVYEGREEEVIKIFENNGLIKGKTVVFSPYSNTLDYVSMDFWELLAKRLCREGYIVCTNVGSNDELPIQGTKALRVSLDMIVSVVNYAGCFIGVRSGLCDVISSSVAKKIILYDKRGRFFNCSTYDYFSLNKMGLCCDAIEILYDEMIMEEMLDQVSKYVI